jgi:hypothetical protein
VYRGVDEETRAPGVANSQLTENLGGLGGVGDWQKSTRAGPIPDLIAGAHKFFQKSYHENRIESLADTSEFVMHRLNSSNVMTPESS